jgi:hypothetical protein
MDVDSHLCISLVLSRRGDGNGTPPYPCHPERSAGGKAGEAQSKGPVAPGSGLAPRIITSALERDLAGPSTGSFDYAPKAALRSG